MVAPPAWLTELANHVVSQIHELDELGPVGCHFCLHEDVWEVTLFAGSTEIVGGRRDGAVKLSRFSVDVKSIVEQFDQIDQIGWQSHGLGASRGDELGPHVSIEGLYQGQAVWLRVLAGAPQQFAPARRLFVHEGRSDDVWS
jgi:hypothetical protein